MVPGKDPRGLKGLSGSYKGFYILGAEYPSPKKVNLSITVGL